MACQRCSKRKIRCDIATRTPCTNCLVSNKSCTLKLEQRVVAKKPNRHGFSLDTPKESRPSQITTPAETQGRSQEDSEGTDDQLKMDMPTRTPLSSAGQVMFLGESSELNLVSSKDGTAGVDHYPLPEDAHGRDIDPQVIDILRQTGAFTFPPISVCDELVDSFFRWVAPIVPVINKTRFMKQYQDEELSHLLLHAVLLAGSRVCSNPQLIDMNNSTTAGSPFYMRAKALYDSGYEGDQVIIVQALVLMGWYCAGDITRDAYYWTNLATITAQSSGMHRRVEQTDLSKDDRRLRKRIWWTIFTRDRSMATALGRPGFINTSSDCNVEMICEDDFIESDDNSVPADTLHIQFFLRYVRLCEIIGLVLSQHYSVAPRRGSTDPTDPAGKALLDWLQNCPKELFWEETQHNFWSALLHGNYYTALCLQHGIHLLPDARPGTEENSTLSRYAAFYAAARITSIVDALYEHSELRYCPESMVYSLCYALKIYAHQMRPNMHSGVEMTRRRMGICVSAIKDLSCIWPIDEMLKRRIEFIFGDKTLQWFRANEHNRRTKIMEEAGQDSLWGPDKTKYQGTAFEFKQPSSQPGQPCGDIFTNINQTQNLSLLSNLGLNSMPGDVLGSIHNPLPLQLNNMCYEAQNSGGYSQDSLYGV